MLRPSTFVIATVYLRRGEEEGRMKTEEGMRKKERKGGKEGRGVYGTRNNRNKIKRIDNEHESPTVGGLVHTGQ